MRSRPTALRRVFTDALSLRAFDAALSNAAMPPTISLDDARLAEQRRRAVLLAEIPPSSPKPRSLGRRISSQLFRRESSMRLSSAGSEESWCGERESPEPRPQLQVTEQHLPPALPPPTYALPPTPPLKSPLRSQPRLGAVRATISFAHDDPIDVDRRLSSLLADFELQSLESEAFSSDEVPITPPEELVAFERREKALSTIIED